MSRAVCLYLHVHQPYRVRSYSIFDSGRDHNYFNAHPADWRLNNQDILAKVAHKSYVPTNTLLLKLVQANPDFKISLSITGTILEQLEAWQPEALESFKRLVATGQVEIVAETYYHSLAFFYSRPEFEKQVRMHHDKIKALFGVEPTAFRNTELAYNNDLAYWADQAGYKAIIAEGWPRALGWRSPNYVYRPAYTHNIRLLTKNYQLADDIAFRFSHREWPEWPLTAEKYIQWLDELPADQPIVNLFMDYETFGEHHWADSGIFNFLEHFVTEFAHKPGNQFMTISQAAEVFEPKDFIDVPETITWADAERDLTAWLGNRMQTQAIEAIYQLEKDVLATEDLALITDWRRLQTSDHFYYMCTKWSKDGDVHAYFSPYESPYDGFIAYMNAFRDMQLRLLETKK